MESRMRRLEIKARAHQEQREFNREEVVQLLAWSFLGSRFPLSEKGLELQQRVRRALDGEGDLMELEAELPTVENIDEKIDLYADLDTTPEEDEHFFGSELATVQLAKGCSRQCSHCAANASLLHEGTMMPFVAVVKVAEKKRKFEEKIQEVWYDYRRQVKEFMASEENMNRARERTRQFCIKAYGREGSVEKMESYAQKTEILIMVLEEILPQHPLNQYLGPEALAGLKKRPKGGNLKQILVYNDSEPFDYRDTSLLHSDGTPADLGDAVARLATPLRPVHITTSGWMPQDKIAQRAAEKIAGLGRERVANLRVSFSSFPRFARRSLGDRKRYYTDDAYVRSMINVIETLKDVLKVCLLIKDSKFAQVPVPIDPIYQPSREGESAHDVLDKGYQIIGAFHKISRMFKDNTNIEFRQAEMSRYSGRARPEGYQKADDDRDIMAESDGVFVQPDGTILQRNGSDVIKNKGVKPEVVRDKSIFA